MHFEFSTSSHILFGPGTSAKVPELVVSLGKHALFVTDSRLRSSSIVGKLLSNGLAVEVFEVVVEPDIGCIEMATRNIRNSHCDIVIGLGGGSAVDTGKAAAVLANNPGNLLDYLEVVGKGRSITNPSLPYIAIPTTAGTGSEVTRNAVIAIPDKRIKVSLRSPYMLPKIAVIDPEMTYSMPSSITASTGMDALTQLIEPFVSNSPTPITDALCRDGIALAASCLHAAYKNGSDTFAREAMALVSLYGGMALANAQLGAVHGMANPIGGMSHAPHGAVCARLLPLVMETNLRSLRLRQPDSPAITRYTEIAQLLTGNIHASAEDGTAWVRALGEELDIRPLTEYGLKPEDYPTVIAQSQKANSMKGNPVPLTDAELLSILEDAA
jgi:alcohol dehydrogenase class IV